MKGGRREEGKRETEKQMELVDQSREKDGKEK